MLEKYISKHFNSIYLSLFVPLFSIASLVFFIKIVSLTSIIKMNFSELFSLYLYVLPQILFYTLPIAFFVTYCMALLKISNDYEAIVLFSLGVSPKKILYIILKPAFITSLILLILSLIIIPKTKQIYKSFITYKKKEALLNIKPAEFGQKFGNWLLFIEKEGKKGKSFENVAVYNQKSLEEENFIITKNAKLSAQKEELSLELIEGKGYTFSRNILKELQFEKMVIYDLSGIKGKKYKGIIDYWLELKKNKGRASSFTRFVLISLFPFLSVFFIILIGIKNPRYERSYSYLKILVLMLIFYSFTFTLSKKIYLFAIIIISSLWLFAGFAIYRKKILNRY